MPNRQLLFDVTADHQRLAFNLRLAQAREYCRHLAAPGNDQTRGRRGVEGGRRGDWIFSVSVQRAGRKPVWLCTPLERGKIKIHRFLLPNSKQ